MSDEYNLCFSPNNGCLAFNRTSKRLIYKKPVVPPGPPSVYGDVYVVATVRPGYFHGIPVENYQGFADFRAAAALGDGSLVNWGLSPRYATYSLYRSPVVTGVKAVGTYGITWLPDPVTFHVDVSVTQPSSGAQFSLTLQGEVKDYGESVVYHNNWTINLYGNSAQLLTNVTATPDW